MAVGISRKSDIILLDEPTSALDPNNVAGVKAVIRKLAKSGKTMMIVTHEMSFARSIANRVFYMDQGGIYEDGTPEQIFDHPQRELTRRFIHKLKVFELNIEDETFDFIAADNELDRWCLKNDVPARMKYRIRLAIEEIAQQMLLTLKGVFPVRVVTEYSEEEGEAIVTVSYNGEEFDPSKGDNRMSYDILVKTVEDVRYSYDPDAEFSNTVTVLIG